MIYRFSIDGDVEFIDYQRNYTRQKSIDNLSIKSVNLSTIFRFRDKIARLISLGESLIYRKAGIANRQPIVRWMTLQSTRKSYDNRPTNCVYRPMPVLSHGRYNHPKFIRCPMEKI